MMTTIVIRDVPEEVARALSHQAIDAGKSREALLRDILAAQASEQSARDIMRRAIPTRTDADVCQCWVCDGALEWLAKHDRAYLEENASRRVWEMLITLGVIEEPQP